MGTVLTMVAMDTVWHIWVQYASLKTILRLVISIKAHINNNVPSSLMTETHCHTVTVRRQHVGVNECRYSIQTLFDRQLHE